MGEASVKSDLGGSYEAPPSGYDEATARGSLRPHWQNLFATLEHSTDGTAATLSTVAANIEQQLSDSAFDSSSTTADRPWRLDALPLILDAEDWQVLEAGLLQRCELLNRILKDFYGPQEVLSSGRLPPALVFANKAFLLPACNTLHTDEPLRMLAFDLGRSPDGQWWVLNNRCEAPKGLGYVLENRIVMARCLPELMAAENIERLAGFYQQMNAALQAPATNDALTVMLTGGPQSPDYAEQAYLGRYLGLPVIEGDDLTVREDQLYLKTLEGLQPVRSVVRSLASEFCDPLELRSDSLFGTAGLLNVVRQGNTSISNTLGSGVVENDAIMAFLPGLCEHLLEAPLELPSIATWWCGQRDVLQYVLEHFDELVLGDAFRKRPLLSASVTDYLASDMASANRRRLARSLRAQPHQFVGREPIQLSTVPYFDAATGSLQAAPMTLRLYATWTPEGYQLLPGGLARVSTPDGDISKDVWVAHRDGRPAATPQPVRALTRRSDRNLPSRTADDLFWLGRYQERTEGAVRLYRALFRDLTADGSNTEQPVSLEQLTRLLVTQHYLSSRRANKVLDGGSSAVQQELWTLLLDPDSEDGLAKLLANVQRTAHRLQSRLSPDTWRLYEPLSQLPHLRWRVHGTSEIMHLLNDVIDKLAALAGKAAETMTRGNGWRLMESGKRLERIRFMARMLRELTVHRDDDGLGVLLLILDISDGTLTHRARYRSNPSLPTVLDLLLLDDSNPRSVSYQLNKLIEHLSALPGEAQSDGLSEGRRTLLTLQNELLLTDLETVINSTTKTGKRHRLDRLLRRCESSATQLSNHLSRTYFAHTHSKRR
ncbi:MAG: circularly permuted type 2 ATP-grasp protein [Pseudomonadota bacterium]